MSKINIKKLDSVYNKFKGSYEFDVKRIGRNTNGAYMTFTHTESPNVLFFLRINNNGIYKLYVESSKALKERRLVEFNQNDVTYGKLKNILIKHLKGVKG